MVHRVMGCSWCLAGWVMLSSLCSLLVFLRVALGVFLWVCIPLVGFIPSCGLVFPLGSLSSFSLLVAVGLLTFSF